MIDFFIDCEPPTVTSQGKGAQAVKRLGPGGKARLGVRFFKKAEVRAAEQQYIRWLLPRAPKAKIEGAVRLEVAFIYPWRAADLVARVKGKLPAFVLKTTKPDTDNSIKLLKDTLSACRFWHDDAQVAEEVVRKGWGDRCGIHIRVMPALNDYVPPLS